MNTKSPAFTRTTLPLLAISAIFFWGIGVPVHADDPIAPPDGPPQIVAAYAPYPPWIGPAWFGAFFTSDGFKQGDQTVISADVADTAPIQSVTANLSEVGGSESVPIPLYETRDPWRSLYELPGAAIASNATGDADIPITVTDTLGRSTTHDIPVRLDNTPPSLSIDSLSFVSTTTPMIDDTLRVSGVIDPSETKIYSTNSYYSLYDASGSPIFSLGSFRGKGFGTALSTLGTGTFTDDPIQFWSDYKGEFHIPDATYIAVTATIADGASNFTTATSSLVRIPKPEAPPAGAASNVLFLPGIEGSRLYESANGCDPAQTDCIDRKVWDPSSDTDIAELSLDTQGKSIHDIYTKENDTIDSVGVFKFYNAFHDEMDQLKDAGTIQDWRSVAYDWRLSPDELVRSGTQNGINIDYSVATDTPYIEQTLRELAATSKTGKVTITAHSAGGLVAKALLEKIGSDETAKLVDAVVFVGVPQSGTPLALAGALHGYGTALPADWCAAWEVVGSFCSESSSRAQSRALAQNAPMIYDLLPSSSYFRDVQDVLHPVIAFAADHLFAKERNAYGLAIQNESDLASFGTAAEGGRTKPDLTDLSVPNILNANLFGAAEESHGALDAWSPPASVNVYQIAGWGDDTLSGIEYYESAKSSAPDGYIARYRPQFVEDGDGAVTIPSALMMPTATNIKRYWIDLKNRISLANPIGVSHQNLLEVPALQSFIKNILTGSSDQLPDGILSVQPQDSNPRKKLLFTLYGSAQMKLTNEAGQETILNTDGTSNTGISGTEAGIFGDEEYMLADTGDAYKLVLDGVNGGNFDIDVQLTQDGVPLTTTTFDDLPADATAPTDVDVTADGTVTESGTSTDANTDVNTDANTASSSAPAPTDPDSSLNSATGSDESPGGSAPVASSVPTTVPAAPMPIAAPPKIVQATRTKGIADSRAVLKKPKPIKVVVPKAPKVATTTKAIVKKAPKAKPLTVKAKEAINTMLTALSAQLQGLLIRLKQQTT